MGLHTINRFLRRESLNPPLLVDLLPGRPSCRWWCWSPIQRTSLRCKNPLVVVVAGVIGSKHKRHWVHIFETGRWTRRRRRWSWSWRWRWRWVFLLLHCLGLFLSWLGCLFFRFGGWCRCRCCFFFLLIRFGFLGLLVVSLLFLSWWWCRGLRFLLFLRHRHRTPTCKSLQASIYNYKYLQNVQSFFFFFFFFLLFFYILVSTLEFDYWFNCFLFLAILLICIFE